MEVKLTLGPPSYYWSRSRTLSFYAAVAEQAVDVVYLGETVCSRRHEMRIDDWLGVASMLVDAGKSVVLSTLPLIESESDLKTVRRLIDASRDDSRLGIEANDMGAVHLLAERHQRFIAGASLNVFNARTLHILAKCGATRWVMPPECGRDMLLGMHEAGAEGIETEVLVHGRLPLAHSARCFTARRFQLQKDDCQFRCLAYPEGLSLRTQEGQPFLILNGVQTQSAKIYHLERELTELIRLGVGWIRLSPLSDKVTELIAAYRAMLDGQAEVTAMPAGDYCNGFWYQQPGLEWVST